MGWGFCKLNTAVGLESSSSTFSLGEISETLLTATSCVCGYRSMHACTYLYSDILQAQFYVIVGGKRTIAVFSNQLPRRGGSHNKCLLAAYACHVEMLTLRPPGKLQDQHNYALAEFLLNIHYEKHCINTAGVLREHKGAAPQCAELCRHPSTFTASWPLCPVLHRPHNIPSACFHSCKIDFTMQLRVRGCSPISFQTPTM